MQHLGVRKKAAHCREEYWNKSCYILWQFLSRVAQQGTTILTPSCIKSHQRFPSYFFVTPKESGSLPEKTPALPLAALAASTLLFPCQQHKSSGLWVLAGHRTGYSTCRGAQVPAVLCQAHTARHIRLRVLNEEDRSWHRQVIRNITNP